MLLNKIALIFFGFSVSITLWAADPNFDTESRILTLPRVTVDESAAYTDVQLLLNLDGTWNILDYEHEHAPEYNVTGQWYGWTAGLLGFVPYCTASTEISFIQNGNNLSGHGSFSPSCTAGGIGEISGRIDGKQISFTITTFDNKFFLYRGTITFSTNDTVDSLDLTGPDVVTADDDAYQGEKEWLLTPSQ